MSSRNLKAARKGDIVDASRRAVQLCHKYGIMVVAGLIFGFPDDDEADIVENYKFLKSLKADTAYCQILTPYPKTAMRQHLLEKGLVTNLHEYRRYNGMWANVKTKCLDEKRLQYLVWLHREQIMSWWEPSERARREGRLWVPIWTCVFRPLLKCVLAWRQRRLGWEVRYESFMKSMARLNRFKDLEDFVVSGK